MMPLIRDGELLFVNQWAYIFYKPQIGDVVVFKNPLLPKKLLCKRVIFIDGQNYRLQGDNPADSLDSRIFGAVPLENIIGRVWVRER